MKSAFKYTTRARTKLWVLTNLFDGYYCTFHTQKKYKVIWIAKYFDRILIDITKRL